MENRNWKLEIGNSELAQTASESPISNFQFPKDTLDPDPSEIFINPDGTPAQPAAPTGETGEYEISQPVENQSVQQPQSIEEASETPVEMSRYQAADPSDSTEKPSPGNEAEPSSETYETPVAGTASGSAAPTAENWSNPADVAMKFNREFYDFGRVVDGAEVPAKFILTNTGKAPLEIETVSACFCMHLDYTRDPINPGEKATIEVVFDSNDQVGAVKKDIDIIFKNTDTDGYPLIKRLQIRGRVSPKK